MSLESAHFVWGNSQPREALLQMLNALNRQGLLASGLELGECLWLSRHPRFSALCALLEAGQWPQAMELLEECCTAPSTSGLREPLHLYFRLKPPAQLADEARSKWEGMGFVATDVDPHSLLAPYEAWVTFDPNDWMGREATPKALSKVSWKDEGTFVVPVWRLESTSSSRRSDIPSFSSALNLRISVDDARYLAFVLSIAGVWTNDSALLFEVDE